MKVHISNSLSKSSLFCYLNADTPQVARCKCELATPEIICIFQLFQCLISIFCDRTEWSIQQSEWPLWWSVNGWENPIDMPMINVNLKMTVVKIWGERKTEGPWVQGNKIFKSNSAVGVGWWKLAKCLGKVSTSIIISVLCSRSCVASSTPTVTALNKNWLNHLLLWDVQ